MFGVVVCLLAHPLIGRKPFFKTVITAVNVLDSRTHRSVEVLEQTIYEHLLHCVRTELPEQVLQRFQLLFVQGGTYPEPRIRVALTELVRSGSAKHSFHLFFNRCCFILINRWQTNLLHRETIVQLVEMLHLCRGASVIVGQPSPAGRTRFLVQEYVRSSYFERIRRLADLLNPNNDNDKQRPLSALLHRYPYLYAHCLTNQDDGEDYQKLIVVTQRNANQRFQQDLSSYLTQSLLKQEKPNQPVLTPPKNPTLLSHQEVCSSLKHYLAKVDSRGTYKDMAHQFWMPGYEPQTYGSFKAALVEYISSGIPLKSGQSRFNEQFRAYLDSLNPESNAAPVNDFLLVRTCNQVLNFMVIESKQRPNHTIFMNLLNNFGSTLTVGLMLKVVLLCNKVKPYLERRLSILFQHYESQTRGSVDWLVRCLEKLNLAWTAHFSAQNLSFVHLL
ncbi:hypothetical protein [Altericista sp. CCNU0014]|uniref:hypothetical protein n=1 Tax=Altericista sp. CCNU0014 TaxID=3082949 RepID=UPI00384A9CA7